MTTTTTTMQSESKAARSGYGSGATSIGNAYYYESGDAVFCAPCFRTRHGRECGVCSAKLLKWLTRGGFAYCPHHEAQQLPSCHSCNRLLPSMSTLPGTSLPGNSTSGDGPDSRGALQCSPCEPAQPQPLALADGRVACGKCAASAIDNPSQATELYRSIHAFFAEMGLQMPSGVSRVEVELLAPLDLAARMALPSSIHATGSKDAMQEQFSHLASWHDGGHGEGPGSQAEAMAAAAKCNPLGLTSLDWREMAADSAGAAGGLKGASRKGAVIDPTSLSVRSVALVTSLPKDLCAVTLAHEFGHVFLHLSGIATPAMSDRAAEGLCELFSYLWEHRCHLVGEGDEAQRRRRMRNMETSTDVVYGDGFRDALAAYRACGHSLAELIARVRESGGVLPRANATEQLAAWAKRGARAFGGRQPFAQTSKLGDTEPSMRVDTWRRGKAFDEARRLAAEKAQAMTKCRPECEPRRPRPPHGPPTAAAEAPAASVEAVAIS